jgi:hypothetical protein
MFSKEASQAITNVPEVAVFPAGAFRLPPLEVQPAKMVTIIATIAITAVSFCFFILSVFCI